MCVLIWVIYAVISTAISIILTIICIIFMDLILIVKLILYGQETTKKQIIHYRGFVLVLPIFAIVCAYSYYQELVLNDN